MAFQDLLLRKRRRRRRRQDRPAISAHLLLDDRIKGEVGVLSEDLFADLFPASRTAPDDADSSQPRIHHVAITPWMPSTLSSPATATWTVLPVRAPTKTEAAAPRSHSSLQYPASSLALQLFANALQAATPYRQQRRDAPIEIRILDTVPLGLDTVYVQLDTDGLRKLDEVHSKFGGGFGASLAPPKGKQVRGNGKQEVDPAQQERRWKEAVRKALQAPSIVHAGDMLPLPIQAHPITHVPPPPAKIVSCEPVAQGLLLPSTRIIILRSNGHKSVKSSQAVTSPRIVSSTADEDDDTSNEQFYSAAEDRSTSTGTSPPDEEEQSETDALESELSGTDCGDLSDDSEDMISLSAPSLPPQSSGALSAWTSATPRAGAFQTNGMMSPGAGSVYSTFTAKTASGGAKGRLFKAQALLERIPDELMYPKPGSDDDEEARVFVDTNTLVKVGCFSGDWVKIEASEGPSTHALGSWGLGNAFGNEEEDAHEFRAVKIFGLPEILSKKTARYPVNRSHGRKSSYPIHLPPSSTGQAYASPVLLANLGSPSHMRISPLQQISQNAGPRGTLQKTKIQSSALPPFAKEVTLLKLSTPLSTDRMLQSSLFAGLKDYFEQKRRIVKSGDMIAIAVDEFLGRAVFQGNNPDGDADDLLSKSKMEGPGDSASVGQQPKSVAWFKVGNVTPAIPAEDRESGDLSNDIWGGIVLVDAANTKMVQAGSEQGKLPASTTNPWQYYLGAKRQPIPQVGASSKPIASSDLPAPYISPLRRRLRELMLAATTPRAIHLGLPPLAILVTSTQRQIGKATVATRACEDLGLHTFTIDSFDILTEGGAGGGDVKTEAYLKTRAERALACGAEYTALLLKHVEVLNADRMVTALKEVLADSRVLIATTTEVDKVPEGIRSLFTHELDMSAPDEGEREGILRGIVTDAGIRLSPDVDLSNVAVKTAALVAGDLVDVLDRALVAKATRLESLAAAANASLPETSLLHTVKDIELAGGPYALSLTKADVDTAVDAARKNFADAIGAPKIPNVSWSDVGGLTHVKDAVMETIQLPLSRPELFAKGMKKRSGILFYGPPGTGKTLLAKAIATEFSLNFFSVKGPELLNMYIGESEANVRRVFQRARDARPCVVFFDELDSVAPKRGNQGDSGGVMDRIVSQLLAELDGMSDGQEGAGGVFVIGATNRPDLLDQALLRPGRFDKMLYLGVSDSHDKQLTILEALTRKFTLSPALSLSNVAATLPFTYTGADLYALCSDAMLKAITRRARAVDAKVQSINASRAANKATDEQHQHRTLPPITVAYFFDHLAEAEDTAVVVEEEDFEDAKRELVPSVSAEELMHYERVRMTFEGAGKGSEKERAGTGNERKAIGTAVADGAEGDGEDDDEDEYVIRTDHLKVNGNGKGKGKGKVVAVGGGEFGDGAEGDEEMYA
ncbi:peroxisomal biogenesis factor 6 [Saccharata proteae CBS 121410]|uniref:Peroxisomal ATPase PEX6 n=1 Tax=Saccharata proteae CBS 121410 TaxID=1314787 RepID=A0A9P4LW28_9PEZI|nr:peroxisomal biogenesis factor 6 [Saccharata proteae CBS 121410]